MGHVSDGATALLGLDGFVLAHVEIDGEVWIKVETTAGVVGCERCGTRAIGHGRRRVVVRDLPVAGRAVVLVWAKRLWRCPDAECPTGTWSETHRGVGPRMSVTERARSEMCRRVGEDEDSVAGVARAFGVGWGTVMRAVIDHGTPRVDDPSRLDGVTALGLDETRFLAATGSHRTLYVTGFVDLDRARLLDVARGRSAATVSGWLEERDDAWLDGIEVAALDPHAGYANGLKTGLGHAVTVVDHFHAVRLGNRATDDVRRRVQNQTLGHRGRKGDPLYGIRRLLLTANERLTDRGRERLTDGLRRGDPDGEVAATYLGKELLREVYEATGIAHARRRLEAFYLWCADADVPELRRLARTISRWQNEVLAYHTTGHSNGPTEAVNLLIEKIRRVGHGFRNYHHYRLRLLLRCGIQWDTPPVARIRGRKPRLVA